MTDRLRARMAWLLAVGMAGASAAGCSAVTRRKLMTALFDATASPNPPTRRVRRDLAGELEELKRQVAEARADTERLHIERAAQTQQAAAALPAEQASRWDEAFAVLPKRADGAVDWDAALAEGIIAPRATANPRAAAPPAFDLSLEVSTSGRRTFTAAFSHGTHAQWLGCQSCHPQLFPLRGASREPITMASIAQRRSCGLCHGTVAFSPVNACSRCHTGVPAAFAWAPAEAPRAPIETVHRWEEARRMLPEADDAPAWTQALIDGAIVPRAGIDPLTPVEPIFASDVTRRPGDSDEFRVVFPHSAHTAWLSCSSCHPDPYAMQANATPMSMDQVNSGQLCGTCHGSVSFPASACGRCHPAMEATP